MNPTFLPENQMDLVHIQVVAIVEKDVDITMKLVSTQECATVEGNFMWITNCDLNALNDNYFVHIQVCYFGDVHYNVYFDHQISGCVEVIFTAGVIMFTFTP